jgi:hypothetical protein
MSAQMCGETLDELPVGPAVAVNTDLATPAEYRLSMDSRREEPPTWTSAAIERANRRIRTEGAEDLLTKRSRSTVQSADLGGSAQTR